MATARIARPLVRSFLIGSIALVLSTIVLAQRTRPRAFGEPPLPTISRSLGGGAGALPTLGDSPLAPLASFAGRVDAFVEVVPHDDSFTPSAFTVSGIPAGATILQAWVLVTSFQFAAAQPCALTFDGVDLGSRLPDVADPGSIYVLSMYRFDVTGLVTGNGSYPYDAPSDGFRYGECLVVVYEHAGLPLRTVTILDGCESLQMASSSTVFPAQPAGPARLLLFTQADDIATPGGESVEFGGLTIASGEIFSANVGNNASLLDFAVTATEGDNTLSVTTAADWFGFHMALLSVEGSSKVTLDFETDDAGQVLVNGQDVQSGEEFGSLVEVNGISASGLRAAIFDSDAGGPNDPSQDRDLLVGLGNVLILQERPAQTVPGIYDRPNDDAGGGTLAFDFLQPVTACALDLVDIDIGPDSAEVRLLDAAGRSRVYAVPDGWTEDLLIDGAPAYRTLDLTTLAPQPGFAAVATATETPGFDPAGVLRIELVLGGSGAVDNLSFVPSD